jgi:hypothetical protein
MPLFLYNRSLNFSKQITEKEADRDGKIHDIGFNTNIFVVESDCAMNATALANEWLRSDVVGDMALCYRNLTNNRSYAYLTRL